MAEQMRPASPEQAPDPSNNYERSHPERESGMGRLDNNKSTPTNEPDQMGQAVKNKQDGTRQVNADDSINQRGGAAPEQPDHSMKEEEPLGSDQAPTGTQNDAAKRHPRTEGKGGTP